MHECDPSANPLDTPVSQLRVLRLLDAMLDRMNLPAMLLAHAGFGDCPACLTKALDYSTSLLVAYMSRDRARAIHEIRSQIAALERSTGWTAD